MNRHRHRVLINTGMVMMVLGFLSACTMGTSFKGPGYEAGKVVTETENDQVIVGLTYIETGDDSDKNHIFWDHVMHVYDTMEQHEGLIGYEIRREIFGNKGWTMSVWKDDASLNAFVESDVHQAAIKNGMPALAETRFARIPMHKDAIPLSWEAVEHALEREDKGY